MYRQPVVTKVALACVLISPLTLAASFEQQLSQHLAMVKTQYFSHVAAADVTIRLSEPAVPIDASGCPEAFEFSWRGTPAAGNNTVKLSCPGTSWQQYLTAHIAVYRNVLITTETLERGETLLPGHVQHKRMDIGELKLGFFTDPTELAGYTVQRTLKSGQVLTPFTVKAPLAVNRGDWVTIQSHIAGLTVTSSGEALRNGQVGEQIPVKNLRSDAVIKAWIVRKGLVSTQPVTF